VLFCLKIFFIEDDEQSAINPATVMKCHEQQKHPKISCTYCRSGISSILINDGIISARRICKLWFDGLLILPED
jgi:hypothetical protein